MNRPKYVASCSGGKDSVATLLLAAQHNEPLDEAVFSEVMFDKDTSGEVPEHRDFIYDRLKPFCEKELGIKFTILHADKTYDDVFHHVITRGPHKGEVRGFAWAGMCAVNRDCKIPPVRKYNACLLYTSFVDPKNPNGRNGQAVALNNKVEGCKPKDMIGICLLYTSGYLVRHRQRDGKGRMSSTIFEIYEEPQESTPEREMPHTGNPCVEKPDVDNPRGDKSAQISTDQVITQERNTLSKNYQSINLDVMDRMDERSEYEEIIKENLDYNILCQDPKFDKDRFREIMDIMLDAICSTAPTIRINGENMPQQVAKSRFLKLNSSHIEYVLEAMNKNRCV